MPLQMPNLIAAINNDCRARSQLFLFTSRIFHLRISHRIFSNASTQRSKFVRFKCDGCIKLVSYYWFGKYIGSLAAGAFGSRVRMKMILFWMYTSRAIAILIYLAAPKEPWTFYIFAAVLGVTWLATVPPTAGLIGKLFGVCYLATLFGFTLLSHQIGGLLGAWFGGIAVTETGSYQWMWWADAALVNLPIREERPVANLVAS
jgi:MFS family permease